MNMLELDHIVKNKPKATVLYNGDPVFVESVDNNSETAQIRMVKTKEIKGVYVKDLTSKINNI